ncbi:MAG TPA: enolase C-terminal domain-like protein [Puia sp.]|nr:enolase C-terminal domain-like protein [Puia sp.]
MEEAIHDLTVSAYRIPTESVESDGTLEWNSTTLVLAEVASGGKTGIGYTYGDASIGLFIHNNLKSAVVGQNPQDIPGIVHAMSVAIRNEGHSGVAQMALSAVETALWDLKAKLHNLPLCQLIGMIRKEVPVYGSGGFTSYTEKQLTAQLGGWIEQGLTAVKMKIGREPGKDVQRVRSARRAIGKDARLFVDANGAYSARQALELAQSFSELGVTWFEEPVSSDDRPGLKFMRQHVPVSLRIAAGEYGYAPGYFLTMLQAEAVDVLQADVTRCGGFTGFLKAGLLSEAFQKPFSFHCAPALHLHAALCIPGLEIGEYFHDHVRIEQLLFEGAARPVEGFLRADLSRPGLGLAFKAADAGKYQIK